MSYEDSFEREAADERAYRSFEAWYIFENFQPEDIGRWEWLLMFDKISSHPTRAKAMKDAQEMTKEIRKSVNVVKLYEGCFKAIPADFFNYPSGSFQSVYFSMRFDFIRNMVIREKYPDLVEIARRIEHKDSAGIFRYYINEVGSQHKSWQELAKRQSSLYD